MPLSKELFLAILSMDAYNRGYGAGIADGGEDDPDGLGETGRIGSAEISFTLSDVSETFGQSAQTAGFYAVAYTMGDGDDVPKELRGKTVISYRGTDNTSLFSDPILGGTDILQGWIAGIGDPTSQTDLAIQQA